MDIGTEEKERGGATETRRPGEGATETRRPGEGAMVRCTLFASDAITRSGGQPVEVAVGPFDWIQITYDALRVSEPDGEIVADFVDGAWYLTPFGCQLVDGAEDWQFSDIIISGEEK